MSMEALGDDIFSILRRFTSPRMGTFDNTNAPRPMPPKAEVKANTDAARAISDPARYGATGSDAGTGLVPQPPGAIPPQPVARRVVPAGGPPAAVAGPDPVTTGAVTQPPPLPAPSSAVGRLTGAVPPPPGDGSRATALVNAPDGPAETGAAPAQPGGGGGEFDFILNSPIYRFQKLQQAKAYAENERQQRMENAVSGIGKIIGGATGRGGGGIAVRKDISEDPTLTYAELADLQKQAATAQADARLGRVIDVIAKRRGWDRAQLEGIRLTHPETFAKLNFNTLDEKALAEAEKAILEIAHQEAQTKKTVAETEKLTGVDTELARANTAQSLAAADASKASAEKTRTVDTEAQKANVIQSLAAARNSEAQAGKTGQEMISLDILSDEQLKEVARSANKPTTPEYIQTLRSLGTAGVSKLLLDTATASAGVAQPNEWQGKEIETRRLARGNLESGVNQIPQLSYLHDLTLDMRQGSISADVMQKMWQEVGYLTGKIDPTTMNTEQYNAAIQSPVQKVLKTYGSNASTPDLQAAQKGFGQDLNPETARRQLAFLTKTKIWDVISHNKETERMAAGMTEGNAVGQRLQKLGLPPPDESTLRLADIPQNHIATLRSKINTPQEKDARDTFAHLHGKHMAEWVLGEIQ